MKLENLIQLWKEFKDEDMGDYTFNRFMDWLEGHDTTPSPHGCVKKDFVKSPHSDPSNNSPIAPSIAPSHVEGRRYICLSGPEWYDRYEQEKAKLIFNNEQNLHIFDTAARRAAGLGDGDE